MIRGVWLAFLLWTLGGPLRAWALWPYATEPASTLPEGTYSVSVGVGRTWQDSRWLRGGRGTLWTLPEVEARLGVGPHAEVSAYYEYLAFRGGGRSAWVYDSGDLRLWTKLGVLPRLLRGLSLRFGMKLPNASEREGLGTDETDVFLVGLWEARLGRLELNLNGGLGLLGNPNKKASQDDVFVWAGSVRLRMGGGWLLGTEAYGYSGPFGLHRKRDFATLAAVVSWCRGPWALGLAGRRGVQDALGWGWVLGVTFSGR